MCRNLWANSKAVGLHVIRGLISFLAPFDTSPIRYIYWERDPVLTIAKRLEQKVFAASDPTHSRFTRDPCESSYSRLTSESLRVRTRAMRAQCAHKRASSCCSHLIDSPNSLRTKARILSSWRFIINKIFNITLPLYLYSYILPILLSVFI